MRFISPLAFLAATAAVLADTATDPVPSAALEFRSKAVLMAAKDYPNLDWDNGVTETADVDSDGELDHLIVGLGEERYLVAVAISRIEAMKVYYIEFAISRTKQRASCGIPLRWKTRPRSERPLNALGAYPTGYSGCDDCMEHVLYDNGECDPIVIYWNLSERRPAWWRA